MQEFNIPLAAIWEEQPVPQTWVKQPYRKVSLLQALPNQPILPHPL